MPTEAEVQILKSMLLSMDSDDPQVAKIKERLELAHQEIQDAALLNHMDREAGGYGFLNEKFDVLHYTSVPKDDEDAIGYSVLVAGWYPDQEVKYIIRRELMEHKYKMIPYKFEEGRWIRIEQAS